MSSAPHALKAAKLFARFALAAAFLSAAAAAYLLIVIQSGDRSATVA